MILISLSVKTGFATTRSSAGLAHGSIVQTPLSAAQAIRSAVRFG